MADAKKMTRRERNLADIRDRATPVAERSILEEGTDALSARRMAKDLNIAVGSLYNAFGDLEGVVRSVTARASEMLTKHLLDALDRAPQNRRDRVVALGEAYFDFAMAEPERWSILFEHPTTLEPDERSRAAQTALLDMLISAGEGDPESHMHRQFFLVLWASVHGLVSLAHRPNIIDINPAVARSHISALVDAGLDAFPADRSDA